MIVRRMFIIFEYHHDDRCRGPNLTTSTRCCTSTYAGASAENSHQQTIPRHPSGAIPSINQPTSDGSPSQLVPRNELYSSSHNRTANLSMHYRYEVKLLLKRRHGRDPWAVTIRCVANSRALVGYTPPKTLWEIWPWDARTHGNKVSFTFNWYDETSGFEGGRRFDLDFYREVPVGLEAEAVQAIDSETGAPAIGAFVAPQGRVVEEITSVTATRHFF